MQLLCDHSLLEKNILEYGVVINIISCVTSNASL